MIINSTRQPAGVNAIGGRRAVYLPGEGIRIHTADSIESTNRTNNCMSCKSSSADDSDSIDDNHSTGGNKHLSPAMKNNHTKLISQLSIKTSFQQVAQDEDKKETMSKDEIDSLRKSVLQLNRPLNPWYEVQKPFRDAQHTYASSRSETKTNGSESRESSSPATETQRSNSLGESSSAAHSPQSLPKSTQNSALNEKKLPENENSVLRDESDESRHVKPATTTINERTIPSKATEKEVDEALKCYSRSNYTGLSLKQQLLQQQQIAGINNSHKQKARDTKQPQQQQQQDFDITRALASDIKMLEQLEIEHLKRASNLAETLSSHSADSHSGSCASSCEERSANDVVKSDNGFCGRNGSQSVDIVLNDKHENEENRNREARNYNAYIKNGYGKSNQNVENNKINYNNNLINNKTYDMNNNKCKRYGKENERRSYDSITNSQKSTVNNVDKSAYKSLNARYSTPYYCTSEESYKNSDSYGKRNDSRTSSGLAQSASPSPRQNVFHSKTQQRQQQEKQQQLKNPTLQLHSTQILRPQIETSTKFEKNKDANDKMPTKSDTKMTRRSSTAPICCACGGEIENVILQALGASYHTRCFRCAKCQRCLDGIPFAVDTVGKVFCMDDYEEMFIPACVACRKSISAINEFGQIIRVAFQDREYHIECFNCEGCGLQLSNEEPSRCYPLSSHLLCHRCHVQWKRLGGAQPPITDL